MGCERVRLGSDRHPPGRNYLDGREALMIVWDAPGFGFGDLFVAINFCARESEKTGLPSHISEWAGFDRGVNQRDRLQEIINELRLPSGSVVISPEPANTHMHGEPWGRLYFETLTRWAGGTDLAIQFDGRSSADLKNPPPHDLEAFTGWAAGRGIPLRRVGLPSSVSACVQILSHARAFVGSNSGMSHLALSVGIPTFVVEYGVKIDWWYGPNRVRKCEGMEDCLRQVGELLDSGD